MQTLLKNYLASAGLAPKLIRVNQSFIDGINRAHSAEPEENFDWNKIFTYPVPKLSPDGSCSKHDELEDKLYDLHDVFNLAGLSDLSGDPHQPQNRKHATAVALFRLNRVVELLHTETQSDWTGIYVKHTCHPERGPKVAVEGSPAHACHQSPTLIKLAYRGRPSRAEFPLTSEFAAHSNNSTVGLNGKAVLVNNVETHLAEGKPYYECDASVQSELCLPIFSSRHPEPVEGSPAHAGDVIGIIDLESFHANHFTDERIFKAATVCMLVSETLQKLLSS